MVFSLLDVMLPECMHIVAGFVACLEIYVNYIFHPMPSLLCSRSQMMTLEGSQSCAILIEPSSQHTSRELLRAKSNDPANVWCCAALACIHQ